MIPNLYQLFLPVLNQKPENFPKYYIELKFCYESNGGTLDLWFEDLTKIFEVLSKIWEILVRFSKKIKKSKMIFSMSCTKNIFWRKISTKIFLSSPSEHILRNLSKIFENLSKILRWRISSSFTWFLNYWNRSTSREVILLWKFPFFFVKKKRKTWYRLGIAL